MNKIKTFSFGSASAIKLADVLKQRVYHVHSKSLDLDVTYDFSGCAHCLSCNSFIAYAIEIKRNNLYAVTFVGLLYR